MDGNPELNSGLNEGPIMIMIVTTTTTTTMMMMIVMMMMMIPMGGWGP